MAQKHDRDTTGPENWGELEESNGLVLAQLTGTPGPAPGVVACRRRQRDRRRRSVGAFIYGNFRPRRRNSRRADEYHRVMFDWHEPRVLYVALAVLLLSCTDALFTLNLLLLGANEANALMDSVLARGVDAFLAVKISMTAISIVVLVGAANRKFFGLFRVVRLLELICLGYVVLIGYEIWLFSTVFGVGIVDLLRASLTP
ncbi:MAG: hypothetical protein HKN81_08135 [Gammaproteobacteria bacterium]|nr:hypothetical protein [Gammaproteobacteria bacterium]